MLSTTLVHRCPRCQGERLYKNGHTVRGAQRAKGKDCQRTFTLAPKGPRHSPTLKTQVMGRLPGPPEPARYPPHLWRLPPDGHQVAGGGKAGNLPAFVDALLPGQQGDGL